MRYALPLILWLVFIFLMSTPTASAETTRTAVRSILRTLFPGVDNFLAPDMIVQIDFLIRKCAHLTEYTILGILLYRALGWGRSRFDYRVPLITLIFGILYAASDEFHQSFYPEREASPVDVLIDACGVGWGTLISLWRQCAFLQKRVNSFPDSEEE
ncbi:MAG: VanZ family protein [Armatimonadaceae bacterium]